MNTNNRLMLIVLVAGMLCPVFALAARFTPPDLTGFTLQDERDADGDGDGINETRVHQYFNAAGDSAFSLTTQGRQWAWSLDTNDDDSGLTNYVIRDSDCDGVYDEVYGLDDEFRIPECISVSGP